MSSKTIQWKNILPLVKWVHLIVGTCLIISGLIWCFFIFKGLLQLGHMPVPGDPAIVSFDGPDKQLIFFTLCIMVWGTCICAITTFTTLIGYLFKLKIINRTNLTIGVIGIVLNLCIVYSPQFVWILD